MISESQVNPEDISEGFGLYEPSEHEGDDGKVSQAEIEAFQYYLEDAA